jgi:hypothetical protein
MDAATRDLVRHRAAGRCEYGHLRKDILDEIDGRAISRFKARASPV